MDQKDAQNNKSTPFGSDVFKLVEQTLLDDYPVPYDPKTYVRTCEYYQPDPLLDPVPTFFDRLNVSVVQSWGWKPKYPE